MDTTDTIGIMAAIAELKGSVLVLNQQMASVTREVMSWGARGDAHENRLRTVETEGASRTVRITALEEDAKRSDSILRSTEQAANNFTQMRESIVDGLEETRQLKSQIKLLVGVFTIAFMVFQGISSWMESRDRASIISSLEQRLEQRMDTLDTTMKRHFSSEEQNQP
jgi:hypothetical protein